jgi:hypothetical protein
LRSTGWECSGTRLESSRERRRGIMVRIAIEWWLLYALIVVVAFVTWRILLNGIRILGAALRDGRNSLRELDGAEILRELKAIKYIIEGFESDYDGFVLKERAERGVHQE